MSYDTSKLPIEEVITVPIWDCVDYVPMPIPFEGADLAGLPDDIVKEIRNVQAFYAAFRHPCIVLLP